ncbi:MAG: hypothetical protein PVI40_04005 [Chlamydiota bacterium]
MKKFSTCHPGCPSCTIDDPLNPPIFQIIKIFFEKNKIQIKLVARDRFGWRIKVKPAVRTINGKTAIGLFKKGSHKLFKESSCTSHHPLINEGIEIVEKAFQELEISGYNETSHTGLVRNIQLVVDVSNKKLQLTIVANMQVLDKKLQKLIKKLQKMTIFSSIWVNFNENRNNVIFSNNWKKVFGQDFVWQKILGKKFAFHPASFMQANLAVFEEMIDFVVKNTPKGSKLLEIYAGNGVFAYFLEKKCQHLCLVESNPFSKISYLASYKNHPRKERFVYTLSDANQFNRLDSFDTILVDPPRKGLHKDLLKRLIEQKEKRLIYVSCNPETFIKDAEVLLENGYQIVAGKAFLLFPHTNHVEIIGVLEKS